MRTTLRFSLIMSIAVVFAFSAKATFIPTLTMTEVSNTVLAYSWDGPTPQSGLATETSPDHWTFSITDNVVSSLGGDQNENVNFKENSYATDGLVNEVNFFVHGGNASVITVISDHLPTGAFEPGYPLIDNGGTINFATMNGHVAGGENATFIDNADASESVPDTGASAILMLISGAVLLGFQVHRARLVG